MKPLTHLKVLEFEGIGAAPLCGKILAQQGSQVTLIKRPQPPAVGAALGLTVPPELALEAGKTVVLLDLKSTEGKAAALKLVAQHDVLLEGLRPGSMERMGFAPSVCHGVNPALVYGRMTGWGQTGPWALAAGHDLNYVALSGLLSLVLRGDSENGAAAQPPTLPPTVLGDALGALGLAFGVVSGVLQAKLSGQGSVVDAAMLDTAAMLGGIAHWFKAAGSLDANPAAPLAGSVFHGAPFYDSYRTQDGRWLTLCPLEPQFYALLLQKMGYNDLNPAAQYDRAAWPALKARLRADIALQPLAHWDARFAGTDVCYAPVLSLDEAAAHPHNVARGLYAVQRFDVGEAKGKILQAAAAPRFAAAR